MPAKKLTPTFTKKQMEVIFEAAAADKVTPTRFAHIAVCEAAGIEPKIHRPFFSDVAQAKIQGAKGGRTSHG